jgi:hypothetical protein
MRNFKTVTLPLQTGIKIKAALPCKRGEIAYYASFGLSFIDGNSDSHFSHNLYSKREINCLTALIGADNMVQAEKLIKPIHLSDSRGIPLHCVENGFYFVQIAHGTAKYHKPEENDREKFTQVLSNHLRVTLDEAKEIVYNLYGVNHELAKGRFTNLCEGLKPRWENEAAEAIEFLESIKHLSN